MKEVGIFVLGVIAASVVILSMSAKIFCPTVGLRTEESTTLDEHERFLGGKCPNRRLPEDIVNVDPSVIQIIRQFESARMSADDTQLIQVIRDHFLHKPRPLMTKLSRNLFKTLQAEEVDKVLNKVGMNYALTRIKQTLNILITCK